jgi:hypothetical protein
MSRNWILGAVASLSLLVWGCQAQHPTIVKYEKDDGSRTAVAPQDGTYGLYGQGDAAPEVKYDLASGDKIGFQENADGSVNAIAGNNMQTLKKNALTRPYYWKLETAAAPPKSAAKPSPSSGE